METEKRVDPFLKMWEDNFNENFDNKIFNKPNVKPLLYIENTKPFNRLPVVLVAAGPSLDKNIHILKQYKDNVIILCADIVTFKLLENDIIPDFICNVDVHETVQEFFQPGSYLYHVLTIQQWQPSSDPWYCRILQVLLLHDFATTCYHDRHYYFEYH